jgi:hypothetical protein
VLDIASSMPCLLPVSQAAHDTKRPCGMLSGKLMPKTPKGHKRPADVVSNAVHVMKLATGEIEEAGTTEDGKSKAAVELGRRGGLARARALSPKKRKQIAKKAAASLWSKSR